MILLIDNYDSFTYNLAQYLGELGADPIIRRNDRITIEEIENAPPRGIVISPGPCTPSEAGISVQLVRRLGPTTPILGVCLGHQAIGQAYGGQIVKAPEPIHGKTSPIEHTGQGVFRGIDSPLEATRYHSLVIERDSMPECLAITAWTAPPEGLVMGVRHLEHPVQGVQFHPESILTSTGKRVLRNFLEALG